MQIIIAQKMKTRYTFIYLDFRAVQRFHMVHNILIYLRLKTQYRAFESKIE